MSYIAWLTGCFFLNGKSYNSWHLKSNEIELLTFPLKNTNSTQIISQNTHFITVLIMVSYDSLSPALTCLPSGTWTSLWLSQCSHGLDLTITTPPMSLWKKCSQGKSISLFSESNSNYKVLMLLILVSCLWTSSTQLQCKHLKIRTVWVR